MHANHNVGASQQQLVRKHVRDSDAYVFFNLLTSEDKADISPTYANCGIFCLVIGE